MLKAVLSVRMSVIAGMLLVTFGLVIALAPQMKLTPGQLALFSVNTFLFSYYFAPLLAAQKTRVANLNATARTEQVVIYDILTQSHLLTKKVRHDLKVKLRVYLDSIIENPKLRADNLYYDELLYYSKQVKGQNEQVMNVIYERVVKTQTNRDTLNNLFASKVYSHEWLVVSVLFGVTLFFALQTNYQDSAIFAVILAVLCTGLTLLMVILIKFATLTHKEARRMWQPLHELVRDHFDDVTLAEAVKEKQRIEDAATLSG